MSLDLELTDLRRRFGDVVALDGVSFEVAGGSVAGFVGANGVWVATGVIEEKSSRVVEVLLSTICPRHLMAGKIAGIGTLGQLQLILIAIFAVSLATVTGAIDIPADSLSAAALTVGWFVLGFSFYAALRRRGAGLPDGGAAERDRPDQPGVRVLLHLDRRRRRSGLGDRQGRVAPPDSSALAMPVRMVLGSATTWEIVASLAIVIGFTSLLIPLAGRVYAGAILRTGARVTVRDAWRAAD
jgi:ABC-2 type transport system permease protein